MEHSLQDSAKINSAYAHESAQGIRISPGPYVGIVKSNTDPLRSGKLQVWIPELGGDPDDHSSWRTMSYCTPFYGVTDVRDNSDYKGNPHSYGMWFVPPDIGVKVLCTFANGNPFNGFWFGCIPEWPSLHMVPGISAAGGNSGVPSPVVDFYDENSERAALENFTTHNRKVHEYQEAIWDKQGLLKDPDRGPGTSSAFRETPSNVFGISTPGQPFETPTEGATNGEGTARVGVRGRKGGHTFIMDDGDYQGKNAMMRFRTSGGHMIMMNDTKDFIYVINSKGTGWVEINSQGDMNVYSGSKVNIFAQSEVNVETKGALKLHGATVDIVSDGALNIQGKDVNVLADGNAKMTGKTALHLKGKNSYLTGDACLQIKSDGHIDAEGACHTINTKAATKATEAGKATPPQGMPSKETFSGRASPPNPQAQQPYGSQQGQATGASGPYGAPNNFGNGGVQPSYGPMTNNIPPIVYTNNPPGLQGQGNPIGNYAPAGFVQTGISYAAAALVQNLTFGGGAYFDITNLSSDNNSSPEYSTGELQNNPGNLQYVSGDAYAVGFAHNLAVYARPEQGIAALITLFDSFAANPSTVCAQLLQQYLKATNLQDPRVVDAARFMQNNLGIGPNDYVALKDPTTRIGWAANIIKYIQGRIIYTYDQVANGCALSLNIDIKTFLNGAQPVTKPWQNSSGANPYSGFVNPATNNNLVNSGASPMQQIGNYILNNVLNNVVGTVAADVGASVGNTIRQTMGSGYNTSNTGSAIAQNTGVFADLNGKVFGNGQCAALPQSTIPNFGTMSSLQQGQNVMGSSLNDIKAGTVIITTNFTDANGNPAYAPPGSGGVSGQSHTAVFLDYHYDANGNRDGMIVQDQYSGKACGPRVILNGNGPESADKFYVAKSAANGYSPNGVQVPGAVTKVDPPADVPIPPTRPDSLDTVATSNGRNLLDPAQQAELRGQTIGSGTGYNGISTNVTVSQPTPQDKINTLDSQLTNKTTQYNNALDTFGPNDPRTIAYQNDVATLQSQKDTIIATSPLLDKQPGDATGSVSAQIDADSNSYYASGYPRNSDSTAYEPGGSINTEYNPPSYNSVPGLQRTYDAASGQYQYIGKDDAGNNVVIQDSTVKTLFDQGQTPSSLSEIGASGIKSIEDSGTLQSSAADTTYDRDTSYMYNTPSPTATDNSYMYYDSSPTGTGSGSSMSEGPSIVSGTGGGDSMSGGPSSVSGTGGGSSFSSAPSSDTGELKYDPRTNEVVHADASQPTAPITADTKAPGAGSAAPGGSQGTPGGSAATGQGAASC